MAQSESASDRTLVPQADARQRGRLRQRLLHWYDRQRRDLPWRRRVSLYRVWVSEIMLQQTRVATVIPYYLEFVKRFPNLRALAAADLQQVLKAWEGLGYYRRARQLHQAANIVVREHGGCVPTDFSRLVALPGIGRYTAGAILSIAADARYPVLEGNTRRLYTRLLGCREDPKSRSAEKSLWQFAQSLLPQKRVGDFNQALMDLGSEICVARNPRCALCPLQECCAAFRQGQQLRIPVPARRLRYEDLHEAAVVVRRGGKVLLRQCEPQQRWAGLWDFPRYQLGASGSPRTVERMLRHDTGLQVILGVPQQRLRHCVTRYRIQLDCYLAQKVNGRLKLQTRVYWMAAEKLVALPLNVTARKIAASIL